MPSDSASTRTPTTVAIVPHTHWDREWYSPFQAFRLRLVALLDDLLPLLERDLSYARFLLDGQTAVLDDYLEVRPEAADALRRLATSGRLAVGPWMILMDEFMVSGETIVRDLQLGMARATELGGAMPVGYLPDMFGHVAQMPQLLRQAGLEHAVVWRGVPAAVTQTAFWWEAPDGSRVRAEYLYGSYSNGRDLPDDAKQLVARAHGYELELGDVRLPDGGLLLMNGTDHQAPQPWLGRVVAEANAVQDDYRFVVTSLPEYLADQPTAGLATWTGELRSGARANVLMGVASNRVDVHQVCAAAERAIERRAEPMSALLAPADRYPHALLDIAWRQLVLNSAHDSSCACSADEVVDAVVVRYQEARQIGDGLVRQALHSLASEVDAPAGSTVVVNPTGRRPGRDHHGQPCPATDRCTSPRSTTARPARPRWCARSAATGFARSVVGQKVRWVLEGMHGPEFAGTRIGRYEVERHGDVVDVDCFGVVPNEPAIDLEELREELLTLAEEDVTFNIRVHNAPVREVIVAVAADPGLRLADVRRGRRATARRPASTGGRRLDRERAPPGRGRRRRPARGPSRPTTVCATEGLGRLVDGGDGGDTYNYSPPAEDVVIDRPESVTVDAARLRAGAGPDPRPRRPTAGRSARSATCSRAAGAATRRSTVIVEHHARAPDRRVVPPGPHASSTTSARDHRLRGPLPVARAGRPLRRRVRVRRRAPRAHRRGRPARDRAADVRLPPVRRRVERRPRADGGVGLAVLHDGLLEYELVDDGRELALTLLRATGYLSRADLLLRPNPAGPLDPLEGPQLQRDLAVEYALLPHHGIVGGRRPARAAPTRCSSRSSGCAAAACTARAAPLTGRPLRVEGAVVSAVLREPGGLVVRVYNPRGRATVARLERDGAPATGWVTDLLGRPQEQFQGELELGPDRIATLRLD